MITRDGAYVSLWQDMPVYETQRKASSTLIYDVVIVGGRDHRYIYRIAFAKKWFELSHPGGT